MTLLISLAYLRALCSSFCVSSSWNLLSVDPIRSLSSPKRRLYVADALQLSDRDDVCAEGFPAPGLNGVTSAQPQRNIDPVQRGCWSTDSFVS